MNQAQLAHDAFLEALIRFLAKEEKQKLQIIMELKMEEYSLHFSDHKEFLRELHLAVQRLKDADLQAWLFFHEELSSSFSKDPELEILFVGVAEKKGLPFSVSANLLN